MCTTRGCVTHEPELILERVSTSAFEGQTQQNARFHVLVDVWLFVEVQGHLPKAFQAVISRRWAYVCVSGSTNKVFGMLEVVIMKICTPLDRVLDWSSGKILKSTMADNSYGSSRCA